MRPVVRSHLAGRDRRVICAALFATLVAALALAATARADRGFARRFSADANGSVTIAANTLETCPDSAGGCDQARAGTGSSLNNNDFAMQYVDVDRNPATFDSSSARLELPGGARVLFAGLYYGARTDAGTRGARARNAAPDGLRTVDIKAPGDTGYTRLDPSGATLDQSSDVTGAYQVFHDVTDLVRRAGAGEYTVADVQAGTGLDRYAGWSLVVAYEAPGDPPRNLTVFDGLQSVTRGQPALTIPISGFRTPLGGPVRTQLGFVAYEGDRGSGGDRASLDGQPLGDPTNFFDSGISVDGSPVQSKTPDYRNQLGFDSKLVRADGILPNGATDADISLRTSLEQYLPGAVTFATDLYAPDVHATKRVENLTHPGEPARADDRLRYTITYRNTGAEAANEFVATDQLPDGVTLVPGSLRIAGLTPPDNAPSDLAGDDLGEYDPGTRTVRFLLGGGATPDRGGALATAPNPGSDATVSFEVEVDPSSTAEELINSARATFHAPSLDRLLSAISDPARIEVRRTERPTPDADVAVDEHETDAATPTGGEVLDAVTVIDHGPDDATDEHVEILAPDGATITDVVTDDGNCASSGAGASCELPHLDDGGSAQIDVTEDVPVADESAGAVTEATITSPRLDEDAQDNTASASAPPPGPVLPASDEADLRTSVVSEPAEVPLGGLVTDTVRILDRGPGTATGVVIDGALSLPAEPVALHAPGLHCGRAATLHCSLARLRPGDSATIRMTWRPRRAGRLTDSVQASSDRDDPQPGNDQAATTTVVRASPARLRLSERIEPRVVDSGGTLRISLHIGNASGVQARAVSVCLRLPKALAVVSAPGAGSEGHRLCWTLARLDGHRSRLLAVIARVAPDTAPSTQLHIPARLTGANVPERRTQRTVDVRGHFAACPSSSPGRSARLRPAC
jgi:large repetitive protein